MPHRSGFEAVCKWFSKLKPMDDSSGSLTLSSSGRQSVTQNGSLIKNTIFCWMTHVDNSQVAFGRPFGPTPVNQNSLDFKPRALGRFDEDPRGPSVILILFQHTYCEADLLGRARITKHFARVNLASVFDDICFLYLYFYVFIFFVLLFF